MCRSTCPAKNGLPDVRGVKRVGEVYAVVVELVARRRLDHPLHFVFVQSVERDAVHAVGAADVAEHRAERMTTIDLGVAVGGKDQQWRGRVVGDEVLEQLQRGGRRPVNVVEHEGDGMLHREPHDEIAHRAEESQPLDLGAALDGVGRVHVREQPTQFATVSGDVFGDEIPWRVLEGYAKRVGERLVRDSEVFGATREQHEPAVVVDLPRLVGHEPRLADARFAHHEHRVAMLVARGVLPRVVE